MDGDWNADGDSYWGETSDDVDLYPDVYVGRITANTGVQCSTVVHKVLTYEGYYSLPTDYQLDMLFMAEYLDDYTNEALLKNQIDNESVPARFDPITKLYESTGNLNRTNALNEMNAGQGIINHAGHGNINVIEIADDILTDTDMENLTNAPRYSVFYTLACDPGAFDNLTGCFARSFLEASNGGGFIIANSRVGWNWSGNPGNGTADKYDREFFKSIFVRGYTNLGVAHADAKVQRIPYAGRMVPSAGQCTPSTCLEIQRHRSGSIHRLPCRLPMPKQSIQAPRSSLLRSQQAVLHWPMQGFACGKSMTSMRLIRLQAMEWPHSRYHQLIQVRCLSQLPRTVTCPM